MKTIVSVNISDAFLDYEIHKENRTGKHIFSVL